MRTKQETADPARLAELEAKNHRLEAEILRLRNQELKLHKYQDDLDRQYQRYRRLYEVGQKFNSTFALDEILTHATHSVLYDFQLERACILVRDAAGECFRVHAFDGYYDADARSSVCDLVLEPDLEALAGLTTGTVLCEEGCADRALRSLGGQLGVDAFVLLPLGRDLSDPIGILVAGNSARQAKHHNRIEAGGDVLVGLANLASQTSTAMVNANIYNALLEERRSLEAKVEERTRELSEAMKNLQELDRVKTQFFTNISHELRTPLTLCVGPTEMLLREEALPREARRHLQIAHNNQLRLLRLIDDLLDFAKLEAGNLKARYRRQDVAATLRRYVGLLASAAEARQIELTFRGPSHPVELYLDLDKFEKIIMNLLSNALKFTPEAGSITVELEERAQDVLAHVHDTGIGIPQHALTSIFERFSQVDASESRAYAGTGIGLALVKELAELHGGDVTVDSVLGQGSTFTVRLLRGCEHLDAEMVDELPAVGAPTVAPERVVELRDSSEESHHEQEADEPLDDGFDDAPESGVDAEALKRAYGRELPRTPTVLVVDDTRDMRQFIASLLKPDYRVLTAVDGVEGLERARAAQPDLVVADLMMPRMTGTELCRAIKTAGGDLGRIPVLLCTAKAEVAAKLDGFEQGADDYLVKPFNPGELRSRVRNLVRMHRQEDEILLAFRALASKDRLLQQDLEQARTFQQSIIAPPRLDHDSLGIALAYQPAGMVGGDFVDVSQVGPGRLRVLVADATGHGIQAALRTMVLKAEYERWKAAPDPEAVLRALNERAATSYGRDLHFTACCVDFQNAGDDTVVRCASAGHRPPILVSGPNTRALLAPPSQPIGLESRAELATVDARLRGGDRFFLYTDGAVEARNHRGNAFGLRRLLASVRASAGATLERALESLLLDIDGFCAAASREPDDRSVVAVERMP